MNRDQLNEPALLAAIDVIGRANAVEFEVGYLDDTEHWQDARWWASARWRGRKVLVEDHPGPAQAAEALARRILNGGTCTHCGKTIVLTATRPKGSRRKKLCAWRRDGARWVRGCAHRIPEGRRLPYAMPGQMERGELPQQP
jgi:hypothetical protein